MTFGRAPRGDALPAVPRVPPVRGRRGRRGLEASWGGRRDAASGSGDLRAGKRYPGEGRDLPKVTQRGGGPERTSELSVVTRSGVISFPPRELTSIVSAVSGVFSPLLTGHLLPSPAQPLQESWWTPRAPSIRGRPRPIQEPCFLLLPV